MSNSNGRWGPPPQSGSYHTPNQSNHGVYRAPQPQQWPQQQPQRQQPQPYEQQPQPYEQQPQQSQRSQTPTYQQPIVKAFSSGGKKVIDFKNRLVMATFEDADALHGAGGANHSTISTIRVTLCDSSRNPSVTVKFNIQPYQCQYLYDAALDRKLGRESCVTRKDSALVYGMAGRIIAASRTSYKKGGMNPDQIAEVGKAAKDIQSIVGEPGTRPDFEESFQVLNAYGEAENNGKCQSKYFVISHTKIGKNGEPSRYPWLLAIRNGTAENGGRNGSTYTKKGSYQEVGNVFINLSDDDFYKCMYDVCKAIDVWSVVVAGPQLAESEKVRYERELAWQKNRRG